MSVASGAILRAKNGSISLEWGAINSVYALFSRFVTTFQIMDSNRSRRRPNREFIFYHEKPAFLKPQTNPLWDKCTIKHDSSSISFMINLEFIKKKSIFLNQ